ncbi:kinase-like domain-containing protein [Xylaria scruposa]|nr:kinase-like domain-containing protein [Xylaria scruposa]
MNCDTIVPLLGVDARLSSLFISWINAKDLGHSSWRFPETHCFRGTPEDAARVISDISRALEHLAEHDIIHHDIKPANILYSQDEKGGVRGGAMLIDFGLGTQGGGEGNGKGEKRHNGGTPWYVPPEFLSDARRIASEDVWALGIVALYLLRLIPLPECGTLVKQWQLHDAAVPKSDSNQSMEKWLTIISGVVDKGFEAKMIEDGDGGEKEGDGGDDSKVGRRTMLNLYGIVKRMLHPKPFLRITPREIRVALETLKGQSHG